MREAVFRGGRGASALALLGVLAALLAPAPLAARTFYEDDPLLKMPVPLSVGKITVHASDRFYDFFVQQGDRQSRDRSIPAEAVNTLGEVPDSSWYTNRHFGRPMTMSELMRGAGDEPPSLEGPWKVTALKNQGVALGLRIQDVKGRKYLLKFDPRSHPEMASAADVIGSKFFYALGFNVPENYIVYFDAERLVPSGKVSGQALRDLLRRLAKDPAKGYRAMASRIIGGDIVGPFEYHGTRSDDPNDIVPHERRRDLRGLFVFSAWLDRTDAKADNTLDSVAQENGVRFVKHYLIDFTSCLGSANIEPKTARSGHAYLFTWGSTAEQVFSLGLDVPLWARFSYTDFPSAGRFDWRLFDPEQWKPHYPIPAFLDRLPQDSYWAAKQVMAFTDEEIRAIVKTGQISDPAAEQWIVECLIRRRDKIGAQYFAKVPPLDHFAISDGRLTFEDLAVKYDLATPRQYTVQWSWFDNQSGRKSSPLPGATSFDIPRQLADGAEDKYMVAEIRCGGRTAASVYLRKQAGHVALVGIERTTWAD